MQISINDPAQQTLLFGLAVGSILLFTFYKKNKYSSLSLTQELKGFAILTIILAHIGYGLSTNSQFLFPLSIFAGVGVNLFLFLSGYGLTYTTLRKDTGVIPFYKQRLSKLFIPFWIVLSLLFLLDYFLLGKTYSVPYIFQSALGIFTSADMYTDVNSPFWYFSLIVFYYLLFPLVFTKRYTWMTALGLYLAVWLVVKMNHPYLSGVIGLYEVHLLAFPLGVLVARYMQTIKMLGEGGRKIYIQYEHYLYPAALLILCALIGYLGIHSNVGEKAYLEEATSLCTMFAIILLFILKKRESQLLSMFGLFSYEIYLFHWPLMYRYDLLYSHLPAWIATLLYLGVFLVLASLLKKLLNLYKSGDQGGQSHT